jgi:hypothetical protein
VARQPASAAQFLSRRADPHGFLSAIAFHWHWYRRVYALAARYVLELGGLGVVRTKTLKAFPETAYREIIRSLG